MFTGIIQAIGQIEAVQASTGDVQSALMLAS